MIDTEDIISISDGFILAKKAIRSRQSVSQSCPCFVRDSTGLLIGRITDYAISESDLQLAAIEMQVGLLGHERRIRIWIMDYSCTSNENEIIVPSSIGSELIYSIRGNA